MERVRAITITLLFKRIPARIIIGIVIAATAFLNIAVAHNGVSPRLSPRYILTDKQVVYNIYYKVEPGEYSHTHESHDN